MGIRRVRALSQCSARGLVQQHRADLFRRSPGSGHRIHGAAHRRIEQQVLDRQGPFRCVVLAGPNFPAPETTNAEAAPPVAGSLDDSVRRAASDPCSRPSARPAVPWPCRWARLDMAPARKSDPAHDDNFRPNMSPMEVNCLAAPFELPRHGPLPVAHRVAVGESGHGQVGGFGGDGEGRIGVVVIGRREKGRSRV